MLTGERLQVKTAEYKLLVQIYRKIKSHNTPHLTKDYLSTLGVSASQVDHLRDDGVDPNFNPRFFEPASRKKLQALLENSPQDQDSEYADSWKFPTFGLPGAFDDVVSSTYALNTYFSDRLTIPVDEARRVHLFTTSGWAVYCPRETRYRPLDNYTGIQNWQVTRLFDVGTSAKSHMVINMINEINAKEDCLLQGELMAMIRVMHGRVPYSYYRDHLVFPILIISYTGVQHARLIQGHNLNGKLHIQYTKLYDLRTEQTDIINLFLRYYLSQPVGDTTLKHIKG